MRTNELFWDLGKPFTAVWDCSIASPEALLSNQKAETCNGNQVSTSYFLILLNRRNHSKQKYEFDARSLLYLTNSGISIYYSHERISLSEIKFKISSNDRFSRPCTDDEATLSCPFGYFLKHSSINRFLTSHMWAWYDERMERIKQLCEVRKKIVLSRSRLKTKSVRNS